MKKSVIFLFAALLLGLFTACGSEPAVTPPPGGAMVVNPMQGKESLAQVNEAIGCRMKAPEGISVSDEKFFVISGTMGEYRFTADGISYTLRASAARDDISGVYVDGKLLGDTDTDTVIFSDGRWTRWFDGSMQYSLLSGETGVQDTSTLYRIRDALQ